MILSNHPIRISQYVVTGSNGLKVTSFTEHFDETLVNYNVDSQRETIHFKIVHQFKTSNHDFISRPRASNFYEDYF